MSQEERTEAARRIAVARYGALARVEPIEGPSGSVFRVRGCEGVKILKLGRGADAGPLRKEHMLIGGLRHEGIPVPVIEHADLGSRPPYLIMDSAGEHRASDYMRAPPLVAQNVFAEMGALLARIHAVHMPSSGHILPDGRIEPRDRAAALEKIGRRVDEIARRGLIRPDEAALFRSLPMPDADGASLCHGDFHSVQCIVREGHVTAVVDWEAAWAGNPAIDFAVTQAYLEVYCPKDLLAAFAAAYLSHRKLPAGYERDYLPVRMAQALTLARLMDAQGQASYAARALEVFRAYVAAWAKASA